MASFLEHHGVPGQEWGVRNGPPYPIDREKSVNIKKGTKLHSTMTSKKIEIKPDKNLYVYDSNEERSKDVYIGVLGRYKKDQNIAKNVYDHTFVASEDLLLPSMKEKIKTFKELYKNDNLFRTVVDEERTHYENEESWAMRKWDEIDKDAQKRLDRDYRIMMTGNMTGTLVGRKFINSLKDKGYNAMIDDNDAYIYNNNPLIVFSQSSLEHVGQGRKISNKEIEKHVSRV